MRVPPGVRNYPNIFLLFTPRAKLCVYGRPVPIIGGNHPPSLSFPGPASTHPVHIPGISNVAADARSWNNLPLLLRLVPEALPAPNSIPPALAGIFLYQQPDWLSSTCMLQHLYASAASVGGSCRVHSKVICIRMASLPSALPTSRFPPCPASEHQLMLFATFLSKQGLSW
jgi:hypothetical protein